MSLFFSTMSLSKNSPFYLDTLEVLHNLILGKASSETIDLIIEFFILLIEINPDWIELFQKLGLVRFFGSFLYFISKEIEEDKNERQSTISKEKDFLFSENIIQSFGNIMRFVSKLITDEEIMKIFRNETNSCFLKLLKHEKLVDGVVFFLKVILMLSLESIVTKYFTCIRGINRMPKLP